MFISGFSPCDLANGDGARVSLFVSGCSLHCKGCFSPETHNRNYGQEFDTDFKEKVFKALENKYIKGLSLLGGDPLEDYNLDEVTELCKEVKAKFPQKTIWLWTGRKQSYVQSLSIIEYLDVVISEPYIEKKQCNGKYFGSSNQKIWWAKTGEPFDVQLETEHSVKYEKAE